MPFAKWRKFMVGFGKGRAGYVGLVLVDSIGGSSLAISETVLSALTLPANSLYKNGQSIRVKAFGNYASNANNKQVKLYWNGTVILDSGAVGANNKSWYLEAVITRSASKVQQVIAEGRANNAIIPELYSQTTIDDTADVVISVKGTAATADGDVTCKGMLVEALTV